MNKIVLNDTIIEKVKKEATEMITTVMGKDPLKVILCGSCARGDYTQDSDIALITTCDRLGQKSIIKNC